MGTTYYLLKPGAKDRHSSSSEGSRELGVRAEAGFYCTKDRVTLCKGGPTAVHKPRAEWLDACPVCGTKPETKNSEHGQIAWVHSFTWGPNAGELLKELGENPKLQVMDDSNHFLTDTEFSAIVELCPLRFNEPNVTL